MVSKFKFALESVLLSYSKLLFSNSKLLGTFMIISTMLVPQHGVFGLIGAIFSNLIAYFSGVNKEYIQKGHYGFSGILIALGLSLFYDVSLQFIFVLFAINLFAVYLTILLNNIFVYYLGVPPIGTPFLIASWFLVLAAMGFNSFHLTNYKEPIFQLPLNFLPYWCNIFFATLSTLLYQMNVLSGVIIATGIFLYSRIAFFLVLLGFVFAVWIHGFLGVDRAILETKFLGFNYIIAALAIGGVFTVPSFISLCLSLLAVSLTVILLVGVNNLLPPILPPHGIACSMSVFLILYVLRYKAFPNVWVKNISSPEENLKNYWSEVLNKDQIGTYFSLPFFGKWKVTQGINGSFTHKGNLCYAYDFQAVDSSGNTYKNQGTLLDDYFAFGLPVISPGYGKIYAINDGLPDNSINAINANKGLGNYVIIEHSPDCFSFVCHLKKDSIKVTPGQTVEKGTLLANCGNSGWSPYPHIHFQVQNDPVIGGKTIPFEFSDVLIFKNNIQFLSKGSLCEGNIAQNIYSPPIDTDFHLLPDRKNIEYIFNNISERWILRNDIPGCISFMTFPRSTSLSFKYSNGVLKVVDLQGDRNTGLFHLGSLISEIPLVNGTKEIQWTSYFHISKENDFLLNHLKDVLFFFGIGFYKKLDYKLKSIHDGYFLMIKSVLFLKTPFFHIPLKVANPKEIKFDRQFLVTEIKEEEKIKLSFVTTQV